MSWQRPYANSETITQYQIIIAQADGNYIELIDECDGAEQTIFDQEYCLIALTTLRASPFDLQFETLV